MKKESILEGKRKKSLRVSIAEGSTRGVASGLGDSFVSLFALKLQAGELAIGLLSALSGLASPLAQLAGSKSMQFYSRKKIVLLAVIFQALLWFPLSALGFLYWQGYLQNSAVITLIGLYTIYSIWVGIEYPAWFSWMGDLVKPEERGKYFSKRNTITGIISLMVMLLGGFVLHLLEPDTQGLIVLCFSLFFLIAGIFRLISYILLRTQYTRHPRPRASYKITLKEFLRKNKNFNKFAIYQAFFNFALMFASPFFIVYMRESLNLDYFIVTIITISSSVFYLLLSPSMGKFSDDYGNKKLFWIANICFAIGPILWVVNSSALWLIIVPQLVSGLANAAYTIAFTNFTYGAVPEEERGVAIAYANVLSGIGIFAGSITGGLLLNYLTISFMNKFIFVFLIASALRFLVALFLLPLIKEKRNQRKFPPLYISLTHPFKSLHAELGWFGSLVKELEP